MHTYIYIYILSFKLTNHLLIKGYIYIYIYVCVCACVCICIYIHICNLHIIELTA